MTSPARTTSAHKTAPVRPTAPTAHARPTAPAAPAKTTAAPAAAPAAKRTKVTAPVIDYSALEATDAEIGKQTRTSALDSTPFVAWMQDSKDRNVAKQVGPIPVAAEKQTVYLIRQAAARLNVGVRIIPTPSKDGKTVTVLFQAKTKRKHVRKADETAAAK